MDDVVASFEAGLRGPEEQTWADFQYTVGVAIEDEVDTLVNLTLSTIAAALSSALALSPVSYYQALKCVQRECIRRMPRLA